MLKEYIDREAFVHHLENCIDEVKNTNGITEDFEICLKALKAQPAADVEEIRHGKWLLEREPDGKPYCFHCSVCDSDFHHIGIKTAYDFCPNCGAKMDEKEG